MGLDMYMTRKTSVKNYSFTDEKDRYTLSIKRGGKKATNIDIKKVEAVVEEVAYWRKENAIHKWFVENVQGGADDCKEYYVSEDDLQKLLTACEKVIKASKLVNGKIANGYTFKNGKEKPNLEDGKIIKNPTVAKAILPVQKGFFFGSTGYDQYYLEGVKYTRDVLRELLKEANGADYYYQSSW